MAKKKSRKSKQRRQASQRPAVAQRETTGGQRRSAQSKQADVDFAEEYSYVYSDLRRVAIIAAAMVVILVVLSFILT